MNINYIFDVLVVYSSGIAKSSAAVPARGSLPFSINSHKANYNDAYAFFMESCQNIGLRAAFSTTDDIVDAGTCSSFWTYENGNWKRFKESCYSRQIFDKFSPVSRKRSLERKLLFSSDKIIPFNDTYLSSLFFDKLKTYQRLTSYTIPTVAVKDHSKLSIERAINKLSKLKKLHTNTVDFGQAIIVKDRYGAGGNKIYKVNNNYIEKISKILNNNTKALFILQPFMEFDKGFSYKNRTEATDIRLVYQNGVVTQTYIRIAKDGDFRCNEHQGGKLIYVDLKAIPQKVLNISNEILLRLNKNSSLFALDFIVSNSGNVYFLEGNIGPGIDWNLKLKENELMSKSLIEGIVSDMAIKKAQITSNNLLDGVHDYMPKMATVSLLTT